MALAINEQMRIADHWGQTIVGEEDVSWSGGPVVTLPKEAQAFVARFDKRERVEPLAFTLTLGAGSYADRGGG